jgi:hypothetical protein
MRIPGWLLAGLVGCVCVAPASGQDLPNAVTFRRGSAVEFYDLRLGVSHDGGAHSARGRDCSDRDFHCYSGVTTLIGPKRCSALRRLVQRQGDWRVEGAFHARFLFVSEQQLYYRSEDGSQQSNEPSGFVYDIERGVIGVWRSPAAARELDREGMRAIVDSTRWLEHPTTLFACR